MSQCLQLEDVKDDAYMSCSLSHSIGNFYARRHAILPEDLDDAVLLRALSTMEGATHDTVRMYVISFDFDVTRSLRLC